MSDLFRSALGYLSNSTSTTSSSSGQGGGYNSASGGPSEESNAVGEVVKLVPPGRRKNSGGGGSDGRNVRITKLIAEGGFSYVFKGVDLSNGDIVAIKKIMAPDEEARQAVAQEKEFLGQFQHEHIANFLGTYIKSNGRMEEHYLGLEFCPVQLPTPPLRLQYTAQVFAQTCRAIKYLHDFGIVHRDIKLENVLIGMDGLVKLVDFGSATMEKFYPTPDWSMAKRTLVEEQIAAKTTPMYRAPEMLDLWSNYPIDEHADLWALGCLLFALNFGQHPFQDSNKLAIVNANYSLPKNISESGPAVSLIRGLLKVDPTQRLSFGQIFDVLVSISESQNFSLNAPLPFKPPVSPQNTGSLIGGVGIVNPLANCGPTAPSIHHHQQYSSTSASGGSLFSSLRGGAVSLIKNIKEQSQQYLAPTVGGQPSSSNGSAVGATHHPPPPPRPAPPSASSTLPHPSRPPPPRPAPPSPNMPRKGEPIEFENREYEAMNSSTAIVPPSRSSAPPARPAAPPSPRHEQHQISSQPKIANLLDISFDSGPSLEDQLNPSSNCNPSTNADLLGDLFANNSSASTTNILNEDDLFWGGSVPVSSGVSNNVPSSSDLGDLLGDPRDPLASLLGKSAPTSSRQNMMGGFLPGNFGAANNSQPFLQPVNTTSSMPQSASFQNLNTSSSSSFLGGNTIHNSTSGSSSGGKIPKNSSSPNLLSDLILGDIISGSGNGGNTFNTINIDNTASASGVGGNSNPTLSTAQASSSRPNYNRTLFDPPPQPQDKKQNLNDVFGDILNSQGFATSNRMDGGRTINDMRKVELLSNPNANLTQIKVNEWREGKKKNIRALLSSLHTITWDGCHWEETNMSQMITPAQVKKVYRKACLSIHPDKQMGEEWEELAKLIFVELNEAWAAFEDSH